MEITAPLKKALEECKNAPDDQQVLYRVESAFWSWLTDSLADLVRAREDHTAFLKEFRELIDFGLARELLDNYDDARRKAYDGIGSYHFLKIQTFSEYLEEIIHSILQGNRKQFLERDILTAQMQLDRSRKEIGEAQKTRRLDVMNFLNARGALSASQQAEAMDHADDLMMTSLETKKAIMLGIFVSVEKKREHFQRENQLGAELAKIEKTIRGISDPEAASRIRQNSKQIADAMQRIIDLNDSIEKLEKEIRRIEEEQGAISPVEIENRTRDEITYVRDLVKLSAKRLRIPSFPAVREKDSYFTYTHLRACLERVIEFDPMLLKNDRVPIFGRPGVLIVPGNGNALYDWKHNQIVVPIMPYQKNHLVSFVSGVIEYRLDVDEDKRLIYSYNELPDNKKIKSLISLKAKLTKDYIMWMTSEYNGFRVLGAAERKWFLHEIAPNRGEIFTPPEYQSFIISTNDFREKLERIENEVANLPKATENVLWSGSILYYQQGKYKRSIELLKELVQRNPKFPFAWFNLGQLYVKAMQKQDALEAFGKFCTCNSQNWWTNLAHEIMKQLQLG